MKSVQIKQVERRVLRAIHRQQMFRGRDRVAVGVSGGKDSTLLLAILSRLRERIKGEFTLSAFRVMDTESPCYSDSGLTEFSDWCKSIDVPLHILTSGSSDNSNHARISNCFKCAWRRREILFKGIHTREYRILALGHSSFDLAVTALMNLIYHGNLETMPSKMEFFDGEIAVIRPLSTISEETIIALHKKLELPTPPKACNEMIAQTRSLIEHQLRDIIQENPHAISNILKAEPFA